MNFKEIYLEEVEREAGRLEDLGVNRDTAYDRASQRAHDSARDRLADAADNARQRAKDEQYD